jgi:hypothetical protein
MHSSIFITSLCATLAVAKPLHHLGKHIKKDYVTDLDIVIETVYVTVTPGSSPVETPVDTPVEPTTVVVMNTVYAQAEAIPATTFTPQAAVFAATRKHKSPTKAPASSNVVLVEPSSSAAPEVVPSSSVAPVVVPATTAAPVVVDSTPAPAPVPATSAAPAADSSYEGTILARHNAHRSNHSASALVYNNTLAGYAKTTAEKCIFAHDM